MKKLLYFLDVDECVPYPARNISEIAVYHFECNNKPSIAYYVLDGVGDLFYVKGIAHTADKSYPTRRKSFVK